MTVLAERLEDRRPGRRAASCGKAILAALLSILLTFPAAGTACAQAGDVAPPPSGVVPLPAPIAPPPFQDPDDPLAMPDAAPDGEFRSAEPVIGGSLDDLPAPVRQMRELIIEAARNADFEALRPLIGSGSDRTQLSFGVVDGDPIDYLRSLSGDPEGYEILAILEEVMEAGYAIYDPGTANEIYVWPYFAATSLETLTPKQRVELFKLITSGDYEDMRSFGAYIFYRAGITPDGRWRFFVAGD